MYEIVNKSLSAEDKFMPKIHLKQPEFTYSASGPFTKHKERIQKFKTTGNAKYIYKNELDKACIQHDFLMDILKVRQKRQLQIKSYEINHLILQKSPKYDGFQRGLSSMVYKFFDKKTSVGVIKSMPNQQLANELHKTNTKKFQKRKVNSSFKDNIWGADLADM